MPKRRVPGGKRAGRQELSVLQRRTVVAEMYMKGMRIYQIAQEVGVSEGIISKDLQEVRQQWLSQCKDSFDQRKAEELAKLEELERVAWQAWERSCRPAATTVKKVERVRRGGNRPGGRGGDDNGRRPPPEPVRMVPIRESEETKIKEQAGDPRFLEQVERCIEKRLRIMGLLKGETTNNTLVINWGDLVGKPPESEVRDAVEARIMEVAALPAPGGQPPLAPDQEVIIPEEVGP
jgi:predicted transcriptional regulator